MRDFLDSDFLEPNPEHTEEQCTWKHCVSGHFQTEKTASQVHKVIPFLGLLNTTRAVQKETELHEGDKAFA